MPVHSQKKFSNNSVRIIDTIANAQDKFSSFPLNA